jgi:hypothetical protein
MAEGNDTYEGLAVPLYGESEIKAQTAANDILTLTGAASHTGDFIVCQNSTATTELFVLTNAGALATAGAITGASLDVAGQVEAASLAVTGIGTLDFLAADVGTVTFAVAGLTSNDVVVLSPREATDGILAVDLVAAGSLSIRNGTSEAANVECNYLVISKT